MRNAPRTALALGAGAVATALILSGCAPGGGGEGTTGEEITDEQREEALNTPTELTFWTWVPDIENEVALFEETYPEIDVKVENVGQGLPHYQKLRSAIEAGEGAPDVAQIEFQYIPSFVLSESLLDLAPYGGNEIEDDYVEMILRRFGNSPLMERYLSELAQAQAPRTADSSTRPGTGAT